MTTHRRDLREFELVAYMLSDKQSLYDEFFRIVGDAGGCRDHHRMLDRCIINAILEREFPAVSADSDH
jgi:hypothetical protein